MLKRQDKNRQTWWTFFMWSPGGMPRISLNHDQGLCWLNQLFFLFSRQNTWWWVITAAYGYPQHQWMTPLLLLPTYKCVIQVSKLGEITIDCAIDRILYLPIRFFCQRPVVSYGSCIVFRANRSWVFFLRTAIAKMQLPLLTNPGLGPRTDHSGLSS